MKSPRRNCTLHSTGSPTAVVFEEIFPSPVVHDTSAPAGMSRPPASANSDGVARSERATNRTRFIHCPPRQRIPELLAAIESRKMRWTENPDYANEPPQDSKVSQVLRIIFRFW